MLFHGKVENPELIGRQLSMLYCFVDGHIYYNNEVIKIRYDLLRAAQNFREFEEHEIFDYYDDILKLRSKETVQHGLPVA